jgi:acyl dehydratase
MTGLRESDTADLADMPRLGPLYRTAAWSAVRRASRDAELAERELVIRGRTVDLDHLAAYNRVCGFRLTDALPATYPHVMAFPMSLAILAEPSFPLPAAGIVHIANRIEVLGPVRVSDTFSLRVRAQRLRPHERGRQVDVVAEAFADGSCVWRGRSTYLHRTGRGSGGPPPERAKVAGQALWRVERRTAKRYAAVSGDRNPVHTSRVMARLAGFRRRIAHGMWTKARALAALEGRLPGTFTVDVRFLRPVLLPSTVAFAAERAGEGWELAAWGAADGTPHLRGSVTGPAAEYDIAAV